MRERYNDEASHVDADGDSQSIFAAQCSSNIQVLQEIRASDAQMTENLNRAAQMLIGARRVYVTGLEGDYASACSAYYDFAKSLDNAFQITLDGGGYMDQIRTISADDVLYVISSRVYNRHVLDVFNCFVEGRRKGCDAGRQGLALQCVCRCRHHSRACHTLIRFRHEGDDPASAEDDDHPDAPRRCSGVNLPKNEGWGPFAASVQGGTPNVFTTAV